MKYLERRCAAIMFLKIGFVVFAIFFCCFVLEPQQDPMTDVICADESDDQIATTGTAAVSIHAPTNATFRLPFAILPASSDLITQVVKPKVVNDFINPQSVFLSLATINAP